MRTTDGPEGARSVERALHKLEQELGSRPWFDPSRPRLHQETCFRLAYDTAKQLGFKPYEVFGKQQGRRSEASRPAREARAQIAYELHERGARMTDIGKLLGGINKSNVSRLIDSHRTAIQRTKEQGND